jgi:hypothetical protein
MSKRLDNAAVETSEAATTHDACCRPTLERYNPRFSEDMIR